MAETSARDHNAVENVDLPPEVSQTILQLGRDLYAARAERDELKARIEAAESGSRTPELWWSSTKGLFRVAEGLVGEWGRPLAEVPLPGDAVRLVFRP